MKLSEITVDVVKRGKLKDIIPELYELKEVVENSDWHNQEVVFDHTIDVLENLGKVISDSNESIRKSLAEVVDINTREDLLRVSALFHDLGKKETVADLGGGLIKCPGHEEVSARLAEEILKRFEVSPGESEIIVRIVKNHGLIHPIIAFSNQSFKSEHNDFKNKFSVSLI